VIHEKCHDNFLESLCGDLFKVIVIKPLTLSRLHDEVLSPSKKFVTPHFCMVEGGMFKGLGDKYQMMCGITCFKNFG